MTDAIQIASTLERAGVGQVLSVRRRHDHPGSTCRVHDVIVDHGPLVVKIAEGAFHHERVAREITVLGSIGHRLRDLAPRLVAADIDHRSHRCIIVLEAIDGEAGDSMRGAAGGRIEEIIDRMAIAWRIEATDPDLRDLDLPDWGRGTNAPRPHRRRRDRFRRRGRLMRERFPECRPIHDPLLAEIVESFEEIARPPVNRPARLIHGDLHLDNVVFSPEGPRVLDWQTTSIGDPVDDVVRLALESQPGGSIDSILELCDRLPETRTSPERLARSLILTYAGLVSGLAGRPDLDPGSREHGFARRLLSPGGSGTPIRQALDILSRDSSRDRGSGSDIT